jgi:hypothetical protein
VISTPCKFPKIVPKRTCSSKKAASQKQLPTI